jgi:hypothetical protein
MSYHRNLSRSETRNPVYAGKIRVEAWQDESEIVVQGIHEPLVSLELFDRVQDVIEGRKRLQHCKPRRRHDELPLRGYIICSCCGRNITGGGNKGNGGIYYYYHCQYECKERFRADVANEAFVEYLRSIAVAPEIAELYLAMMQDVFLEKEGDREAEIAKIEREIRDLDAKLLKIDEQRFVEGNMSQESYLRLTMASNAKLRELKQRKAALESTDTNFMVTSASVSPWPRSCQRAIRMRLWKSSRSWLG